MIAVNKNKDRDSEALKRLVYKYGITDVLLMLADIWRFSHKARGVVICKSLLAAREHIIGEERGHTSNAVQVTDSDPPASPVVAKPAGNVVGPSPD